MKICVIAPIVIPILGKKQKYGGIELVIALAVEELAARGHSVYLFASGDSVTSANLIPIVPRAIGQGSSFAAEKALNKKAYKLAMAEEPDIIWDHTPAAHALVLHKIGNKEKFNWQPDITLDPKHLVDTKDIPVIHTLHGPAKDHMPALVRALSYAGHYFVTISHDQARSFLPYLAKKQHLGTVYNAVDTKLYPISKHKKSNYVMWVGRYGMEKGAHIALAVAHRIGVPIKMAGKLAEPHERQYFDKFIKPNLEPQDEVFDNISLKQKARLFKNARATLMTNLWAEPFGLVAIESMAAGTVVVGPALGALTEIIAGSGVLVPVDDLDISERVNKVTAAQEKYIERVAKYMAKVDAIPPELPRDRVLKLFSIKHNADGYEEAFAKALYLTGKTTSGLLE